MYRFLASFPALDSARWWRGTAFSYYSPAIPVYGIRATAGKLEAHCAFEGSCGGDGHFATFRNQSTTVSWSIISPQSCLCATPDITFSYGMAAMSGTRCRVEKQPIVS